MQDKVIGYIRVSTNEQGESGAGLQAQRTAILNEALRRGWQEADVTFIEDRGFTGKNLDRPGLTMALDALRNHRASTLCVSKLDRLSRSLVDFAGLMARASRERWGLVALDVNVDTSTPSGEAMANMLATFSQFERRLISQRTKDALAAKRSQGIHTGRRRAVTDAVATRILTEREAGRTLQAIADGLNGEGVLGSAGGRWYPGTVRSVLASVAREHERARQREAYASAIRTDRGILV